MTRRERAARLGHPPQVVNEIVRGKKAITPYIALLRAMAMGGDPRFWGNLEADYWLALARQSDRKALATS